MLSYLFDMQILVKMPYSFSLSVVKSNRILVMTDALFITKLLIRFKQDFRQNTRPKSFARIRSAETIFYTIGSSSI
ncbi:unnamed protein product [Hermetia illucens]|uniref:Uncharacterized protein n=1 Tax=Hermetia illucens TaxID=343691 RepID=A0A7R8UDT9_HERIL|nr:unnamed protein product [Hermetia illucens]